MKRALVFFAALAAASFSTTARATPNFPAAVQSDLGLAAAPACTLCHDGAPSITSATTPFAMSLRARGVVPFDTGSLATALKALEAESVDSDGDCAPDVAELRAGGDPNVSNGGSCGPAVSSIDPPRYGCGAHVAPNRHGDGDGVAGVGLAIAIAIATRTRRLRRDVAARPHVRSALHDRPR